jgi:DNA (cytosine-5)-methyltransferase 1
MRGASPTISSYLGTGGNNLPLVQKVFVLDSMGSNAMKSKNPASGCRETDVAQTLDTTVPEPSKRQGGMAIVEAVSIAENVIGRSDKAGGNGVGAKEGVCYTLDTAGVHGVCYPVDLTNVDGREKHLPGKAYDEPDTAAYSLTKRRASGVCTPGIIRRLLPVECERLMGFPDGWTLIPWRNKPADQCPDGPRYKALGNSMCTNVMAWIGERIDAVDKEISDGRQEA